MSAHHPEPTPDPPGLAVPRAADDEPARFLDRPENVRLVLKVFWASCGLLLAVDVLHLVGVAYHKHGQFSFEEWPFFHGIYGFVACVALVLLAKQLRRVVMRAPDYYGEHAEQGTPVGVDAGLESEQPADDPHAQAHPGGGHP